MAAQSNKTSSQLRYFLGLSILVLMVCAFGNLIEWGAALVLSVWFFIAFFLIYVFLPSAPVEQKKTIVTMGNKEPQKPAKDTEGLKKLEQALQKESKLKEHAEKSRRHLEATIRTYFPDASALILQDKKAAGSAEQAFLQREGFLLRIERLAQDGFNIPEAGIGLEQSLMHLYGIELYAFMKAIREQPAQKNKVPDAASKNEQGPKEETEDATAGPLDISAIIAQKCALMNTHLKHVELVNMELKTPFNPDSHQSISGNPQRGMPVEVCSFKILNRRGKGQLLKALVKLPQA